MMQPLPTEIVMLGLGVVLLLLQLFLQSISSTLEMGGDYKAGPRDVAKVLQGVFAGRADRAFRNLLETFPIFAALALALVFPGGMAGSVRWAPKPGSSRASFTCRCILSRFRSRAVWCGSFRSLRWSRCWCGCSSRAHLDLGSRF
jgi:uncharacterized MAPEG superfamily protein